MNRIKKIKTFLALAFVTLGASKCTKYTVKPDQLAYALEAFDHTALVEGCGQSLIPGYTYCRVLEGEASASQALSFVAPPTYCKQTSCATLEVFYPTGEPTLELQFPKGKDNQSQTRLSMKLSDLTKKQTFTKGDRGFWPFRIIYLWIDPNGNEQKTVVEGEIRLRVIAKEAQRLDGKIVSYIPLNEMSEDPNFVWNWYHEESKVNIKMTTGGRTYVSQRK